MKLRLTNQEIKELLGAQSFEFPKYSTQLLNLANQNTQGTRPAVVGQMSELIQEFSGKTIDEWEAWYLKKNPDAIQKASEKIFEMIGNFQLVLDQIDYQLVEKWVKDLVIIKTYIGLRFQEAILKKVAGYLGVEYRLATPEEESKGIDGYLGYRAVSIKPESYKSKNALMEKIHGDIIYYRKTKTGLTLDLSAFTS
ncbi:MAG: MjaI family restriction endonuclease [Calditrichaeota bacterium]|nr:MAG: MjaI family restriction endonuclease [Calditrichota bacterium]